MAFCGNWPALPHWGPQVDKVKDKTAFRLFESEESNYFFLKSSLWKVRTHLVTILIIQDWIGLLVRSNMSSFRINRKYNCINFDVKADRRVQIEHAFKGGQQVGTNHILILNISAKIWISNVSLFVPLMLNQQEINSQSLEDAMSLTSLGPSQWPFVCQPICPG